MRDYGTTNNTPAHQAPPVWRAPEGLEDLTAAQVGDGGACQHTNDKPDRSGAPRGLRGLAAVSAGDGGAAPVTWRCTRYVAVHPNRRGVMPTDRVHCPHQQAQPRIRTPPHGKALHHWACAHVVEGLFMRLWSRPRCRWAVVAPHHRCGGHRKELPRCRWAAAGPGRATNRHRSPTDWRPPRGWTALLGLARRCRDQRRARPRCRWAAAGPGRASRSTTPSEARVWRSRGRAVAHRHAQRTGPTR